MGTEGMNLVLSTTMLEGMQAIQTYSNQQAQGHKSLKICNMFRSCGFRMPPFYWQFVMLQSFSIGPAAQTNFELRCKA